jgi:putative NIF3 family GTP cyclohydrolase 1 type 2
MAAPAGAPAAITADEILQRIRENVGVPWREETTDTVKAGDPTTTITGVVTTSLATIDVLRQAIASQANLIITSGTTFYSRNDSRAPSTGRGGGPGRAGGAGVAVPPAVPAPPPPPPPANPVYDEKNRIIDSNGLVIFRLSDHWRARIPDSFGEGLANRIFGEGTFPDSETPYVYDIPARPLDTLASDVKYRLGGRGGIRVIGDPSIRIRRVAVLPGTKAVADILRALPQVDAIIAGEIREWESSEYMRDVAFSGQQKALILVGRVLSEDPGMALSAQWLEGLVPEVRVRHISAGDPYWSPVS